MFQFKSESPHLNTMAKKNEKQLKRLEEMKRNLIQDSTLSNVSKDKILIYEYSKLADPDFNPEKNKAIIESTIKKHESKMMDQRRKWLKGLDERVEAVYDYFAYLNKGGTKPVDKYFGSKMLAYLKSEQIKSLRRGNILELSSLDK